MRPGRPARALLNIPGGNAPALRMILEGAGPAEYGDPAVSGVMDDHPACSLYRIAHVFEPVVQKGLGIVGVAGCDMAGRSHHIDREHRYDVALRRRSSLHHLLVSSP